MSCGLFLSSWGGGSPGKERAMVMVGVIVVVGGDCDWVGGGWNCCCLLMVVLTIISEGEEVVGLRGNWYVSVCCGV